MTDSTFREQRWVWGAGLATIAGDGTVLDTWFPAPALGTAPDEVDTTELAASAGSDERRDVSVEVVVVQIDLDAPPQATSDAYLRLHALSHLLVAPNELNLTGIFGHLPNVAWTNAGPVHPDAFARLRPQLQRAGIQLQGLDKFPRLTDYVVPAGVRIADASRVRLGAHLAPGTTVMHEGFVNFNAGTVGASMIEGRISQGVVVGDGSDIGGGASIMGTLSGGGTHRVSIGARTLLGANAGIGISLGDDCIVEAGLYVTAGSKIVLANEAPLHDGTRPIVKGAQLSGQNGILFRRNSLSGAIEAVRREGTGVTLNEALHA
ncbi:MAG: 2,3,4,5-tetrahydropyridine-2,6-dicarboxylate N-succinyltransferase [Microbacterium sp. SCN 70-200]|uniref:2,3,4,5-tetrahydropyridine-2,6-dicarboxylate N-succinyltransferase n=1 Tax=unclassified Microbacterium TaxID=2609290 RepID=UPI0008690AB3|nr:MULTISPECIES: 2,3,4,5-tetrahydropyridine-2,6-dicarboxylate N-succinyltransferase [unclassified Microbacterium]MBN9213253.1 2,3,4,5-tetrahydropyridine-2,6-dicarboxylate N-succinyltransferase [Microbacterium sp.]ODT40680.1 MAG: 2,3,4,5-tetrahydropyridine-2,6-dicarboxylate N-succinyltransferase [Microbacterium sp. SCN 70-200]OJV83677.1 MAG: 2,3,4,5-tetrahydropyridine-2,6-dicarboxylate N-succinyltransferase [Microbacterium sp. 70-16]